MLRETAVNQLYDSLTGPYGRTFSKKAIVEKMVRLVFLTLTGNPNHNFSY